MLLPIQIQALINAKTQSYSLLPKRIRRPRVNERARERLQINVLLSFVFSSYELIVIVDKFVLNNNHTDYSSFISKKVRFND